MPSAAPSTFSARMISGSGRRMICLIAPISSWTEEIGCVVISTYGLEHRLHAHPVADQVRRQVAVLDVQALDELDGDTGQIALLDADDAASPTRSSASATARPMRSSSLAAIVAT